MPVKPGFDGVIGFAGEGLVDGDQIEHAGSGGLEIDCRVGIRGGAHDGLADLGGGIEQGDGVIEAGGGFAHLLRGVVEAHDARADGGKAGVGDDEGVGVERIEALRDIAGEFQVLRLVVADGDDTRLVEQDIGGHEDGVLEEPVADGFLFGGLYLVLRHAFEPADGRDAGEHPGELGVGGHGGLHHDGAILGVDSGGEIEGGDLIDFGAQFGRILIDCDGVQVHDTENALVVVLDANPVFERAEVISDVKITGGLHSGEDSCSHGRWQ